MKLSRLEALIFGLGAFPSALKPGATGGGREGRLIGEEVVKLRTSFVERGEPPAAAAAAGDSSAWLFVGGEALRAGLGDLELPSGLANPEANPVDPGAAPLTDALALTSPLIPMPWSKSDIVGGDGLPPDVPEIEPRDPIPPWVLSAVGGN